MEEFAALVSQGRYREAAGWLVQQHSREVLGMCHAMLRDPHAAEDATQDVFSRAFANMSGYRADASPRTWLMRITKNRCIDEIRRRQIQPWRIAEDGEIDDAPAITTSDVAECLTDRETVDDALAALEGDERALVVLRFRHGMSFAELANAFGVREGTARMRITRALKRMRLAVQEPITQRMPAVHPSAYGRHDLEGAHEELAAAPAPRSAAPPAMGSAAPPPPAGARPPGAPPPPAAERPPPGPPGPPAMAPSAPSPAAPPPPPGPPGPPAMAPSAPSPAAPPPPPAGSYAPAAQSATFTSSGMGSGAMAAGSLPTDLQERLTLVDPALSDTLRARIATMLQAL